MSLKTLDKEGWYEPLAEPKFVKLNSPLLRFMYRLSGSCLKTLVFMMDHAVEWDEETQSYVKRPQPMSIRFISDGTEQADSTVVGALEQLRNWALVKITQPGKPASAGQDGEPTEYAVNWRVAFRETECGIEVRENRDGEIVGCMKPKKHTGNRCANNDNEAHRKSVGQAHRKSVQSIDSRIDQEERVVGADDEIPPAVAGEPPLPPAPAPKRKRPKAADTPDADSVSGNAGELTTRTDWWANWRAAVLSEAGRADLIEHKLKNVIDFAEKHAPNKPPTWLEPHMISLIESEAPEYAAHERFMAAYFAWRLHRYDLGGKFKKVSTTAWGVNFRSLFIDTADYPNPQIQAAGWLYLGVYKQWGKVPEKEWVERERASRNGHGVEARRQSVLQSKPEADERWKKWYIAFSARTLEPLEGAFAYAYEQLEKYWQKHADYQPAYQLGAAVPEHLSEFAKVVNDAVRKYNEKSSQNGRIAGKTTVGPRAMASAIG